MKIDTDVAVIAKRFGLDPKLIQAVVNAEGDIVKAVQCSFPLVETREKALDITCRSCVHAMCDWLKGTKGADEAFVMFWGARWAPEGAKNDPTGLNSNWVRNVTTLWLHGLSDADAQRV